MADENPSFFTNLKEKYLNFVENLREKGIPLPHLAVPLLIIIVIAALVFTLAPDLVSEKRDVSLTVKDNLARPLSGATIELLSNNQVVETKTSDSSGKVAFKGVPANAQVRVSAEGFVAKTRGLNELSATSSISLESSEEPSIQVNVKVIDEEGRSVEGAFVQLAFANGDFAPQVTSDAAGSAFVSIKKFQISQGTITVNAPGFQSTQTPVSQEQLESGNPVIVTISSESQPVGNGDFLVTVTAAGRPVQGARVTLIDVVTDQEVKSELTYEDGTVNFEDVAFGATFTIRVNHGQYNPAEREFTPKADDRELSISLSQRTSPLSEITLTVLNEDLLALQATVSVFDATSNSLLESGETNQVGEYIVRVSQNVEAYATAYTNGYLPGFISDLRAGSVKSIKLQQAVPGNSVPLTVVVNQDGFPASNADVSLYRSGGFFLGIPPFKVGSQGIANATIPNKVDNSDYRVFARASKEGAFGQSDLVDVGTIPISLGIDLYSLPANVTVKIQDLSTSSQLAQGTVEALVEGLPVSTCEITAGQCVLTVASNKQFNIKASSPGYLSYTTALVSYSPAEEPELTLSLFPLSLAQGTSITFLGMYDSTNVKVREVTNAETYSAKFAVNLPQNVENAGFYLQVGEGELLEGSDVSITSFDSNGAPFVQSDSQLNTENCYAGQNNPNVDSKWVYFAFPRGFVGTKEFSIKIKVAREAEPGSEIKLQYKAFGFKDNLPLLAPSDSELLETLRAKMDQGLQLTPQDTCQMKLFTQSIPVSQLTLTCGENNLCWRATLYDETTRGTPSTFQPEVAKEFTLEFEVLSTKSIDSLAVQTEHFTVKNAQQTLSNARSVSFAEREFNLPFTSLANRKAKITMRLTPLKMSQSAALTFQVKSGDEVTTVPLTLSISGTNTFTVTAAPQVIPAIDEGKITVIVRDRLGNPVEDAAVTLFECVGSPFSGTEPSQVLGDGTSNNGQNGRYRISAIPTGLGEIGVRVESEGFKQFESCLVSVQARNFLTIEPNIMEFTGSSRELQVQQVTLENLLNEPVRVSSSINCGGDPVPVRVFPTSTTIDSQSNSIVSLKLLENVTSQAQCIVSFNARAGAFKAVEELPLSVNVNCDGCQLNVASGLETAPLPSAITLFVTPPFLQDAFTIPLRLTSDPTCRLDGFRINYAGMYSPAPPIQQGVLAGVPSPALWYCSACSQAIEGKSECNGCQQVRPTVWNCGACEPHPVTAPTSSQLPIHLDATCNQCYNAYSSYRTTAFMSPLGYQGYPLPFNPAYQQGAMGQRIGYDPAVGAPFREDYGYGNDYYGQRFGVYPRSMPGSLYSPSFNGYNRGMYPNQGGMYSRDSLRNALLVEECTRDAITVAADYSFLGQAYPGSGNLYVTLPDGSQKLIRVNVMAGAMGGYPAAQSFSAACGVSSLSKEVKVGPDYKFEAAISVTLTCPTTFDQKKVESVETENGDSVSYNCDSELQNNELTINCDFSKSEKAKDALDKGEALFVKAVLLASTNPNARVDINIKATFEKPEERQREESAPKTEENPVAPGTVSISVFSAGDSSTNLCGERVLTGTPLKVKYTFGSGDDSNSRKVVVKKKETNWVQDTEFNSLSNSGTLYYTATASNARQQFSFEASTKYGERVVDKQCIVNVVEKSPLLLGIQPIKIRGAETHEFTSTYPDGRDVIATKLTVDPNAMKAMANNRNVVAKIEYLCQDGSKIITQNYNLNNPNYKITNYKPVATNSVQFVKCKPQVDAVNSYKVKVTLLDNSNVLETMYYGSSGTTVSDGAAATIKFLNYPEAPPLNLGATSFDACGRASAPQLNAIEVYQNSASNPAAPSRVKSNDKLSLGQDIYSLLCTTDLPSGKTMEFLVEYTKVDGRKSTVKLDECTIIAGSNDCPVVVSSGKLLSTDKLMEMQVDTTKKVSFKARIKGQANSERYWCKYWPGSNGNCEKVELKIDTSDLFAYSKNKHCRLLYPPNPNVLLCDLADGEGVELATGMYLQVSDLNANEVELKGYYAQNGDQLNCDPDATGGKEMEFGFTSEKNKWKSCFDSGITLGETTSFIAVQFKNRLSNEIPFGETTTTDSRVRLVIVSQFGALDSWLKNGYNYTFNVKDKNNGRLLRKVDYLTPVKTLESIDSSFSSDAHQGVYVMGVNDVAKILAGDVGIVRYAGKVGSDYYFEVRRRDKPVLQDCKINFAVGTASALTAIGAAAMCYVPAVNIALCPFLLSAIGGTGGGVIAEWLTLDDYLLPVEAGEIEQCNSVSSNPDVMVKVLKEIDDPNSDFPMACAVITTDNIKDIDAWEDKLNTINIDNVCK